MINHLSKSERGALDLLGSCLVEKLEDYLELQSDYH
jgi:hypothetical protein